MFKILSRINSKILCLAFFAITVCFCGYAEVPATQNLAQTELLYREVCTKKAVINFSFIRGEKASSFFSYQAFNFKAFLTSESGNLQVLVIHQNDLFVNNIFSKINNQVLFYHLFRNIDPASIS